MVVVVVVVVVVVDHSMSIQQSIDPPLDHRRDALHDLAHAHGRAMRIRQLLGVVQPADRLEPPRVRRPLIAERVKLVVGDDTGARPAQGRIVREKGRDAPIPCDRTVSSTWVSSDCVRRGTACGGKQWQPAIVKPTVRRSSSMGRAYTRVGKCLVKRRTNSTGSTGAGRG